MLLAAAWLAQAVHAGSAQANALERTAEFAPRFGEAAFDVAILRPLSAAALAVGSAFFVASVPFVAPWPMVQGQSFTEGVGPAWTTFVYAPYEYTVLRDLGDF